MIYVTSQPGVYVHPLARRQYIYWRWGTSQSGRPLLAPPRTPTRPPAHGTRARSSPRAARLDSGDTRQP